MTRSRPEKPAAETPADPRNSSVRRPGVWPGGLEPSAAPDLADADAAQPFQSVGFTISTIGYAIARRFRELLAPLGLEPRDFALLRAVATTEGVTQQAIAERMRVPPSRMVAFVDGLEERGLLERRQNPDDRRARALFVTPAGRELLERAFTVAVGHEQLLSSELNPEERALLLGLLGRVGEQLGIPTGVHAGLGHSAMADE